MGFIIKQILITSEIWGGYTWGADQYILEFYV